MTPKKPQPELKSYFTEIVVRVEYSASNISDARHSASEMSSQLREVVLPGNVLSTKVCSVRHIKRNLAEEQENLKCR